MKIRDFQLERYFAKYEFRAPYLLSSSDCETFTVQEILELGEGVDLGELRLGYTEPLGHPDLRAQIAELYQDMSPDQVMVTAGAEEAIFLFMNVVLSPGDHIIYMSPSYQSLYEIARSIGCEVTPWSLREEESWEPDLSELETLIRPNTKAIIVNLPHNPTGYLMSREKFQGLVNIARENQLYLFSDEVYRFLEFMEAQRLPAACDEYKKGVSIGVMSKAFGLAGLRIGWIVTQDEELLCKMAALKDYTSICNSAPSEVIATAALKSKSYLLERNLEIILRNLELLDTFFEKHKEIVSWHKPLAGSIAFPRILVNEHVEDFCVKLVESKGVLLAPGNYYGGSDKSFRVGFGRKNMPEALALFDEYLEENYR